MFKNLVMLVILFLAVIYAKWGDAIKTNSTGKSIIIKEKKH